MNGIVVRGRDQVMLKVTVAEVQRDVIEQLGIDINGTLSYGTNVLNFNNANPFPVYGRLWSTPTHSPAASAASTSRCARWSAPA